MKSILRAAIAVSIVLPTLGFAALPAQDPQDRVYTGSHFFLSLDSAGVGFFKSVEGLAVSTDVIEVQEGGVNTFTKKRPGPVKYGTFTLQIPLSLEKPIYDWIGESLKMNYQRKDGSVTTADFNLHVMAKREFSQALITEVGFPDFDAGAKEAGYLTVRITPETIRIGKGSGTLTGFNNKGGQKKWIPSNFRLILPGVDATKVRKIDSFTVKQQITEENPGNDRLPIKVPGKLEFPNLRIHIPEAFAQSWAAWHEDFVLKGNNGDEQEKTGILELLAPNRQDVLARIRLFNVGIFYYGPNRAKPCCDCCAAKDAPAADDAKTVTAELYCERMEFELGSPND